MIESLAAAQPCLATSFERSHRCRLRLSPAVEGSKPLVLDHVRAGASLSGTEGAPLVEAGRRQELQ